MSFDPRDPPDPYDDRGSGFAGGAQRPPGPPVPHDPLEYRDQLDPYAASSEGQRLAARGRVTGPAIVLIIGGILNLLFGTYFVINAWFTYQLPPEDYERTMDAIQPGKVQQLKKQNVDMQTLGVWINSILAILTLLAGVIMVAGGGFMLALKMWGLAVFASILALISPGGCCCILGLVGGIWGLVVLLNSEVRAAFH
jgi:hypothetical protein